MYTTSSLDSREIQMTLRHLFHAGSIQARHRFETLSFNASANKNLSLINLIIFFLFISANMEALDATPGLHVNTNYRRKRSNSFDD